MQLRVMRRTVERDDASPGQQRVERGIFEGAAVVTFEQERRAVAPEDFAKVSGHVLSAGIEGDERFKVVARGQIDDGNHEEFAAALVSAVFGGVDGPGKVGLVPGRVCTMNDGGAIAAVSEGLSVSDTPRTSFQHSHIAERCQPFLTPLCWHRSAMRETGLYTRGVASLNPSLRAFIAMR